MKVRAKPVRIEIGAHRLRKPGPASEINSVCAFTTELVAASRSCVDRHRVRPTDRPCVGMQQSEITPHRTTKLCTSIQHVLEKVCIHNHLESLYDTKYAWGPPSISSLSNVSSLPVPSSDRTSSSVCKTNEVCTVTKSTNRQHNKYSEDGDEFTNACARVGTKKTQ